MMAGMEAIESKSGEVTERRCGRCDTVRPLSMFYIAAEERRAKREGRKHFRMPCRHCQKEINAQRRKPRQDYLDKIKSESGCADCGLVMPEHPEVFDFDHLDANTKSMNLAKALTKGTFEDMVAEVDKCEVVCSNCHRIRTRARWEGHLDRMT